MNGKSERSNRPSRGKYKSGRGGRGGMTGRPRPKVETASTYRHYRKTPLASQDSIIPRHFVNPIHGDPLRIMSTAARGTTVLLDSTICVDAGNLPVTLASKVLLLMITHGHADHVKDICNAFSERDGKMLTLFCPASIAGDLFDKIKLTHQINKGQIYTNQQIAQHLRIFGVVRHDHKFSDVTGNGKDEVDDVDSDIAEYVVRHDETPVNIATLVRAGNYINIDLVGRTSYTVVSFHCHHTVDTVGYSIYQSAERLNKTIIIPEGTVIEITPPKMTKADKKEYKATKVKALAAMHANDEQAEKVEHAAHAVKGSRIEDHNLTRIDFKTVAGFLEALDLPDDGIKTSIVSRAMANGFVLDSIRRIEFISEIEIDVFDDDGECVLPKEVFQFFSEYNVDMNGNTQLNVHHNELIPGTMVFGDTAATVFSQKLVRDLMSDARRIIIECTFLDGEDVLSQIGDDAGGDTTKKIKNPRRNLYLRLKEKKHIFLPELYRHFKKLSDTQFVLIHFSDRYDVETVRDKIVEIQTTHPKVYGAI